MVLYCESQGCWIDDPNYDPKQPGRYVNPITGESWDDPGYQSPSSEPDNVPQAYIQPGLWIVGFSGVFWLLVVIALAYALIRWIGL